MKIKNEKIKPKYTSFGNLNTGAVFDLSPTRPGTEKFVFMKINSNSSSKCNTVCLNDGFLYYTSSLSIVILLDAELSVYRNIEY